MTFFGCPEAGVAIVKCMIYFFKIGPSWTPYKHLRTFNLGYLSLEKKTEVHTIITMMSMMTYKHFMHVQFRPHAHGIKNKQNWRKYINRSKTSALISYFQFLDFCWKKWILAGLIFQTVFKKKFWNMKILRITKGSSPNFSSNIKRIYVN